MGAGAVIGTLVLAQRERASGLHKVIIYSALATGGSYILFSASPSFYLSLAIMPVIGFGVMRQNAAANTSIQMLIPDEYRGRIMSLYVMTVVGLGPFGSLAAGALAHAVGPRLTVLAGGVVAMAAAVVFHIKINE
jgi:dipeptide/tripeptide permease